MFQMNTFRNVSVIQVIPYLYSDMGEVSLYQDGNGYWESFGGCYFDIKILHPRLKWNYNWKNSCGMVAIVSRIKSIIEIVYSRHCVLFLIKVQIMIHDDWNENDMSHTDSKEGWWVIRTTSRVKNRRLFCHENFTDFLDMSFSELHEEPKPYEYHIGM